MTSPYRFLFVTYGGGHVDIVLRLLPHLERLPGIEVRVLALTTAGPRIAQASYEALGCRDYLPLAGYERALDLGAELSKGLWDATSGIPWEESCAYLGVSMIDLITEVGEAEARRRYAQQGRKAFCPTNFLQQVLQQERPHLVITTCHVRMERAAVLATRALGITSVRIEDLFGYSLLGERGIDQEPELLPEGEWPDQVVVLNGEVKRRLVAAGLPERQIHPLGQPVLSEWLEQFEHTAPSPNLVDWRTAGRPVVTYATPARRDVLYRQADAMLALAKQHPEWGLCIKLHPSVGRGEFESRYPQLPDNLRLLVEEDILPIVRASDLVVIFRSTVGLLCLSGGVPLLVVDDTGETEVMPYVSSGSAHGIDKLELLEEIIVELLEQRHSGDDRLIAPLFDNPLGATERIAAWLATEAATVLATQ